VDGLLKEVAERTTHRTASITGQSSVVWLSLNLDSEDIAALCSGSQEEQRYRMATLARSSSLAQTQNFRETLLDDQGPCRRLSPQSL
jgi:hypothetical protein